MISKQGTGRIQWTTPGWFGAQIGGSCWLVVTGVMLLEKSTLAGALMLGCFFLPNLIGLTIWMKREAIDPYRAFQSLILVLLISSGVAIAGVDLLGFLDQLDPRLENPRMLYLMLLVYPAVMILVRFRN